MKLIAFQEFAGAAGLEQPVSALLNFISIHDSEIIPILTIGSQAISLGRPFQQTCHSKMVTVDC